LGFNSTISTNRLYRDFEKLQLKKLKLMRKMKMLRVGNTYNKTTKICNTKDITRIVVVVVDLYSTSCSASNALE